MKLPERVESALGWTLAIGAQALVLFVIFMYLSGDWYYR